MLEFDKKYTIVLRNVDKTLGKAKRIDHINIKTEQGKIYGLIGPNGAGKTTLFNLITGLYKPDNGTIRVAQLDPVKDYKETRRQIGLLPQSTALYPELSARENLRFHAALYLPKKQKEIKKRIDEILALVDLAERADEPVKNYSGGMQRRLGIGRALKCVKEDISFNLATLISPLLFLLAFSLMLSSGVMIPVQTYPGAGSSNFLKSMEHYRTPDGTAYFELHAATENVPPTNAESNLIVVEREPSFNGERITGKLTHYLNDVNANMTKNFCNRLSGAVVNYVEELRPDGNVLVNEITMYEQDIPWDIGFGASVLVFGLMLSGLVFGMLSITSEWGNHTTQLLKLTPYSSKIIIAGKILANIIKCCMSGIVFLVIFYVISKVFPVHLFSFAISVLLVYGIFVSIGMILGIFIKSSLTAFLISLVSALVLWVGGGGFGPLSYYGNVANVLGKINPASYAMSIIHWCYFNGNTQLVEGFVALAFAFIIALILIFSSYTLWTHREGAA